MVRFNTAAGGETEIENGLTCEVGLKNVNVIETV